MQNDLAYFWEGIWQGRRTTWKNKFPPPWGLENWLEKYTHSHVTFPRLPHSTPMFNGWKGSIEKEWIWKVLCLGFLCHNSGSASTYKNQIGLCQREEWMANQRSNCWVQENSNLPWRRKQWFDLIPDLRSWWVKMGSFWLHWNSLFLSFSAIVLHLWYLLPSCFSAFLQRRLQTSACLIELELGSLLEPIKKIHEGYAKLI